MFNNLYLYSTKCIYIQQIIFTFNKLHSYIQQNFIHIQQNFIHIRQNFIHIQQKFIHIRPHKKNSWLASSPAHKKGPAQDLFFI
jgi:hypothetical protein